MAEKDQAGGKTVALDLWNQVAIHKQYFPWGPKKLPGITHVAPKVADPSPQGGGGQSNKVVRDSPISKASSMLNTDKDKPKSRYSSATHSHRVFLAYPADIKMVNWEEHIRSGDTNTQLYRSALRYVLALVRSVVKPSRKRTVTFFVHRYIGDSRSLMVSMLALGFTAFLCFVSRFRDHHLFWFLHNVDKDTLCFHPRIIQLRRRLLAKHSTRIFVLDPLLVDATKNYVDPAFHYKLRWTCFGSYSPRHDSAKLRHSSHTGMEFSKLATSFYDNKKEFAKQTKRPQLVGLCLTNVSEKCRHIDLSETLINAAHAKASMDVNLIVAGGFDSRYTGSDQAIGFLSQSPSVCFHPSVVAFNELEMRHSFDFIWRVVDDLSVPLTAYVAASCRAPILTVRHGFLPTLIERYSLGAVIESDFSNVAECLRKINENKTTVWTSDFLHVRSWKLGASQIKGEIDQLS